MEFLTHNQIRAIIAELAEILPQALAPKLASFAGISDTMETEVRTKWDPVFTGGGIVGLLLSDPAARPPSRTKDVDLVLEIASYGEFVGMENSLRRAGFTQNSQDQAGIVAWQWNDVRVDLLPHLPNELMSTSNRWFPNLIEEAERIEVLHGKFAWRASAPCFIATKFEAFKSRGRSDYAASKDIEDIIAVIDGRAELLVEINHCAHDVRGFVAQSCGMLLADRRFMDCLPQIVPDEHREVVVEARLKQLARA